METSSEKRNSRHVPSIVRFCTFPPPADPHFSLVAATAKELTGAELIQAWHEFALSLQDILEEAEADAAKRGDSLEDYDYLNPPYPLNKCVPIFQELVLLLGSALRHNLPAVQELFATTSNINCADGSVEAAWQRIAQAMKISSAQRIKVLGHWTGYQAKMRALEKERQQAAQSLAAVAAGTGPITSLQRMMEEYLLLFDSSSKVSAAPNGELLAMLELMRHTGHVFTMLQKVRMVVMAYPAYPDIVQLMRAIAAMREPVESGALMSTQDASAQLREAGGAVE